MNSRLKNRPHIDGLRALAVLPVLLFHAQVPYFDGGFVGVDVFFVISGFLITSVIERDIASGTFSVTSFYERRVRRIAPALIVMLLACLLLGMLTMAPNELKTLCASIISAILFVSNFFFYLQPGGYFAEQEHWSRPLLHTWSLAIEEQFYIFFPLLLLATRKLHSTIRFSIVVLMTAVSLLLSCWGAYAKPSVTFFMLPTRMWELLIGSIIALRLSIITRSCVKLSTDALALAGLALTLLPVFAYGKDTIFPGANALAPCLGATMLIVSGFVGRSIVVRCMEWRPIVSIGLISYPLYLWHWPLLSFAHRWNYGRLDVLWTVSVLALTFLFAWLTVRFVEQPIRRRVIFRSRALIFRTTATGSGIIALVALAVILTNGLPERVPKEARVAALINENVKGEWTYPCNNFKREVSQDNPIEICSIGTGQTEGVFFWGDSHVEQIFSEIRRLVDKKNHLSSVHIMFATSGGCLPLIGLERNDINFRCSKFNSAALARALESDIKRVVISGFWTDFYPDENFEAKVYNFVRLVDEKRVPFRNTADILSFFAGALGQEVEALKAAGKQVVIVMPYPTYHVPPAEFLWRQQLYHLQPENLMTWKKYYEEKKEFIATIKNISHKMNVEFADPAIILCPNQLQCNYDDDGVSLYRDTNHLIPRGVQYLEPMLSKLVGADVNTIPK